MHEIEVLHELVAPSTAPAISNVRVVDLVHNVVHVELEANINEFLLGQHL